MNSHMYVKYVRSNQVYFSHIHRTHWNQTTFLQGHAATQERKQKHLKTTQVQAGQNHTECKERRRESKRATKQQDKMTFTVADV